MFIRNCWYVAAWDHEVPAEGLFARKLLGDPVLLYRDSKGRAVAMEDRCCHRAAPLSIGRKEGDCVRCMYHGMVFDPSGICVEIPGQETIPAQARVRTYPVVERNRFVWIWMGDPMLANPDDILDFFWHDSPDWRYKPGYLHYDAAYELIVDNLLDFSHLSFVHPNTLGTSANAAVRPKIEHRDGGLRISHWHADIEMPPNHKRVAPFSGRVDRWQVYTWDLPAILRMDAGSQPTGYAPADGERAPNAIKFRHTSVQTPETESTAHYWFCQARNFALDDDAMTEAIYNDVITAFEEDRTMIEAQQRIIAATPGRKMVAIAADAGLNQARGLIQRRLREEQGGREAA
ncbi:MAG: aromatic ring-hydroxylating dioxygenase subunit alpha [Burkholderiaceae bacterium]